MSDRLTECGPLELFEADEAAGDREEGFVDVGASLVAEAAVLVEQEIVRSTTQRCLPRPEPCSVSRLAIRGVI